jgi:YidC/Oxa1 family membrane protein insertase
LPFDESLRFPLLDIPLWDQYVDFLKWVLEAIGDRVGNGGVAIVIFTIIVRTLILPITIKSIKSMKSMQDIQPKIKELQKKHKGDRMKIQQETMALYQTYGVNPIAGCLPALLQLPIFFGVYRAILNLSNSETGVWQGSFLWLDSLKDPDPWKILPIAAGIFQLVQTFMSRPHNQGKITDPQQAMMNTMMNIMPITVVLFGWTFASGAVVYWVTQSLYGIIQQWFITGWGKLNDYIPNLPELPEHKRLGYKAPRDLDAIDVANLPPKKRGPLGRWWEKQMQQAQVISEERKAGAAGGGEGTAKATASAGASASRRPASAVKSPRPYSRNSPKGRMLAEQARRAEADESLDADITADEVRDADIPANGASQGTPKRTRRGKK